MDLGCCLRASVKTLSTMLITSVASFCFSFGPSTWLWLASVKTGIATGAPSLALRVLVGAALAVCLVVLLGGLLVPLLVPLMTALVVVVLPVLLFVALLVVLLAALVDMDAPVLFGSSCVSCATRRHFRLLTV